MERETFSSFMNVKIVALEDVDGFVQEMSEGLTRELNTLTKSLANVQMQGGTCWIQRQN